MNHYLATAAKARTATVRTVNLYNLAGQWMIGITGKGYANKGMAMMQAMNTARREGVTLRFV